MYLPNPCQRHFNSFANCSLHATAWLQTTDSKGLERTPITDKNKRPSFLQWPSQKKIKQLHSKMLSSQIPLGI